MLRHWSLFLVNAIVMLVFTSMEADAQNATSPVFSMQLNGKHLHPSKISTEQYSFGRVIFISTAQARDEFFSDDAPAEVQCLLIAHEKTFSLSVSKGKDDKRHLTVKTKDNQDLGTPLLTRMVGHADDGVKLFALLSALLDDFDPIATTDCTVVLFNSEAIANCGESCLFGSQCTEPKCVFCQSLTCK